MIKQTDTTHKYGTVVIIGPSRKILKKFEKICILFRKKIVNECIPVLSLCWLMLTNLISNSTSVDSGVNYGIDRVHPRNPPPESTPGIHPRNPPPEFRGLAPGRGRKQKYRPRHYVLYRFIH